MEAQGKNRISLKQKIFSSMNREAYGIHEKKPRTLKISAFDFRVLSVFRG